MDAATGGDAWLRALLDVERGLARAGAVTGVVPAEAAEVIEKACEPDGFDLAQLAAAAGTAATPVIALVTALRDRVPERARGYVHAGATSQDVMDTATVLIARRAAGPVRRSVVTALEALAGLAAEHRDTPQVGRTLLQQAEVTTFGLACATRFAGLLRAASRFGDEVTGLPVQLGGPVGAGDPRLTHALATELGLSTPDLPWHTARTPVVALATAAGVLGGELAGLAQDLVLLAAPEIGEVTPAAPGASSAMPHKQNPARAVLALACAHRLPGPVSTLLAGMPQELQRSAGLWQAEWGALTDVLRLLGGTARHTAAAVTGVHVHADRMAAHVAAFAAATGASPEIPRHAAELVDRALAEFGGGA